METIIDKFPPILQFAAFVGAVIAGAVAWIMARRKVPGVDQNELRHQLDQAQLKADLGRVLEANRESFFKAMSNQEKLIQQDIGELEDRVRELEIEHASFRERLPPRRER